MKNSENAVTLTFKLDFDTGETSDVVVTGGTVPEFHAKEYSRNVGRVMFKAFMADMLRKEVTAG